VVFVGDQNTYVIDLLEDIIVIYKYGMKYDGELRRTFKTLRKRIKIVSKTHSDIITFPMPFAIVSVKTF